MPGSTDAVAGPAWGDRAAAPEAARPGLARPAGRDMYRDSGPGPMDTDEDQVVFTVRPTMMFVWIWYVFSALILIAATAIAATLSNSNNKTISGGASLIAILVVAVVAFSIPVYKHIMRRREVFTLTNHKLEMRCGIISCTVRNIPLRNIQDVTVMAKAVQRLLGIGSIVIDSASESGKIWLSQVPHPERYANMILAEMRRRY